MSDQLIGEVIASRYRIEARLGDGAMGTVYRAVHVKVGRPFAVKVLRPSLTGDETLRRRFLREAELAGGLHHPAIVGMVDIGETSTGLCYLVMEYAAGDTLYDLIVRAAPLPAARVIAIVRQLCDGLAHAHDHGLIHRDFKPENVVVERDPRGGDRIKIIDFGISILRDEAISTSPDRLTTAGLVLGTPHYMAPEQALGEPIDHRVDLFALGVMCFEMLTGRAPFDGDGVEVAHANVSLETPAMRDRAPNRAVDPLLEAFTRRLMTKSRDGRPQSAAAARVLLDLIDRDRGAAARVLGMSLPASEPANAWAPPRPVAVPAQVSGPVPLSDPVTGSLPLPLLVSGPVPLPRAIAAAAARPDTARPGAVPTELTMAVTPRRPIRSAALATLAAIAAGMVLVALIASQRGGGADDAQLQPIAIAHSVPAAALPPARAQGALAAEDRAATVVAGDGSPAGRAVHSAMAEGAPASDRGAQSTAGDRTAADDHGVATTAGDHAATDGRGVATTTGDRAAADGHAVATTAADRTAADGRRVPTARDGTAGAGVDPPRAQRSDRALTALHAARAPRRGPAASPGAGGGEAVAADPTAPPAPSPPAPPPTQSPPTPPPMPASPPPPRADAAPSPARSAAGFDANSVAELYSVVGQELRALEQRKGAAAAADLWPSYLRIRINEALADPTRRETTGEALQRLHTQIARRADVHCDTTLGAAGTPH